MKTIKLPDTDHTDMCQFYHEELDKTIRRLQHIKSVLEKLGDTSQSVQIQITSAKPDTLKPNGQGQPLKAKTKKRGKKKRGPKSMWEMLVLKRMRQLDRPVTYDELTEEIMIFSKLPKEKRKSTKQAIVNVTFRMRTKTKKLDTFSIGTKEKYLALKRWFDKPGEINKAYEDKINKPKPAAKAKKPKPAAKVKKPKPAAIVKKPKPGAIVKKPKPGAIAEKPQPAAIVKKPLQPIS